MFLTHPQGHMTLVVGEHSRHKGNPESSSRATHSIIRVPLQGLQDNPSLPQIAKLKITRKQKWLATMISTSGSLARTRLTMQGLQRLRCRAGRCCNNYLSIIRFLTCLRGWMTMKRSSRH